MKRTSNKLFLCSLTSLAVLASSSVFAEEMATAPSLEGGFTGMLGGFLFVPSVNDQAYGVNRSLSDDGFLYSDTANNNSDYDTGWQAAIGYVFDGTANGIELSYRGFDGSSNAGLAGPTHINLNDHEEHFGFGINSDGTTSNQDNRYQNWDLMISQFLDIGTHMQVRFLGGLSYLSDLDQTTKLNSDVEAYAYNRHEFGPLPIPRFELEAEAHVYEEISSKYSGLGPRIGMDARYDFGEAIAGFGIVGGGSVAYFLGDLKSKNSVSADYCASLFIEGPESSVDGCPGDQVPGSVGLHAEDKNDNHAVTNLRGNLGIDYVYFFDNDETTLGLEVGYEVDAYLDGIGTISALGGETDVTDVTFSGPYINIKGVF